MEIGCRAPKNQAATKTMARRGIRTPDIGRPGRAAARHGASEKISWTGFGECRDCDLIGVNVRGGDPHAHPAKKHPVLSWWPSAWQAPVSSAVWHQIKEAARGPEEAGIPPAGPPVAPVRPEARAPPAPPARPEARARRRHRRDDRLRRHDGLRRHDRLRRHHRQRGHGRHGSAGSGGSPGSGGTAVAGSGGSATAGAGGRGGAGGSVGGRGGTTGTAGTTGSAGHDRKRRIDGRLCQGPDPRQGRRHPRRVLHRSDAPIPTELETFAKAAGSLPSSERYVDNSVSGTTIAGANGNVDQYNRAVTSSGTIKYVIMDGGGNDCLQANNPSASLVGRRQTVPAMATERDGEGSLLLLSRSHREQFRESQVVPRYVATDDESKVRRSDGAQVLLAGSAYRLERTQRIHE